MVSSNRRFAHDTDSLRATRLVGGPAIRGNRFRRSPSFKRVVSITAAMAEAPDRSLPKQSEDWGDLKAAYRFLNNPKARPDRIQQTHRRLVRQRCRACPVVLAVQDTTELDFTPHRTVEGLGPIGNGRGHGLLQHSTLAMHPKGDLIGVLHQIWRPRVPVRDGETRSQRLARPRESDFWPQSVRAIGSLGADTRLIHVTDRGGDLFETMVACGEQEHTGFLIRAQHDRWVNGGRDKLWAYLAKQPVAGYRDVPIPTRNGQPGRMARVSIRFAWVSLDPPCRDPRFTKPMAVWAVYALEENPSEGVEPIAWMLLTSESVETPAEACTRVDWYGLRWVIEEWHRVEKTGCQLEATQLKTAGAIERWAALVAICAVRLLQLRNLAQSAVGQEREEPDSPAHQSETLQALVPPTWLLIVAKLARSGADALTPRQFWLTIAKRGGFIARKNDGPPGWMTIWRGWYDIMMMVHGVELLGVSPQPKSCG